MRLGSSSLRRDVLLQRLVPVGNRRIVGTVVHLDGLATVIGLLLVLKHIESTV